MYMWGQLIEAELIESRSYITKKKERGYCLRNELGDEFSKVKVISLSLSHEGVFYSLSLFAKCHLTS